MLGVASAAKILRRWVPPLDVAAGTKGDGFRRLPPGNPEHRPGDVRPTAAGLPDRTVALVGDSPRLSVGPAADPSRGKARLASGHLPSCRLLPDRPGQFESNCDQWRELAFEEIKGPSGPAGSHRLGLDRVARRYTLTVRGRPLSRRGSPEDPPKGMAHPEAALRVAKPGPARTAIETDP